MDKLILISDLFGVSIDYLIKDNNEQGHEESSDVKYFMSHQKIEDYINFKKTICFTYCWRGRYDYPICYLSCFSIRYTL